MGLNLPPEVTWDAALGQQIEDALLTEAGTAWVCRKVFPTRSVVDHSKKIPFGVLDFGARPHAAGRGYASFDEGLLFRRLG